jgi:hypothetical protein
MLALNNPLPGFVAKVVVKNIFAIGFLADVILNSLFLERSDKKSRTTVLD